MKSEQSIMRVNRLSEDQTLCLVGHIYAAAMNAEAWPGVVEEIVAFMGAPKGKLFTPLLGTDNGGLSMTVGIPEAADRIWATRYAHEDVWVQAGIERGLVREGNVLLDSDLVPAEKFVKSRIYREHLQHLGIGRLCSGIVFDGGSYDTPATFLSVARDLMRPFNAAERDRMACLLPHLSRALGIMYRLRDAELKLAASLAALDRLSSGVLLLDKAGRVTHANRKAAQILERNDGLALRDGLLVVPSAVRHHLQRTIRSVLSPQTNARHFSDAVSVPRPSGRRPLLLQAAPLANDNRFAFPPEVEAVAFIVEPDAKATLDRVAMRDLFEATPAEVRLAELLCTGRTVAGAAEEIGISEATARSQLSSLFRKTGTARQVDLMRLLTSLQHVR